MKIIKYLIISAVAIGISAYLIQGVSVTLVGAIILAVVLGIINTFIKPVVKLIALPITILTLGIFSLVINALFILLASKIVPGVAISGFWSAFWFGIVLSLVSAFFNLFNSKEE